jgi:hypothetical protein
MEEIKVIVKLTGGLGNQAFEYAFGRALSLDRGLPVQFCWQRATRDYELDKYNVNVELVSYPRQVPVYDEPSNRFDPNVYSAPAHSFYRGYWQTEKYFKHHADLIRKELTLKESVRPEVETLAKQLREQNSVFVHVRRGDYIQAGTKEVHGLLPWEYYQDAKNYIREKINSPKFYYFSDEPYWVENNFYTDFSLGEETIISGFNQHEDLYLMQACHHGIGANSSFSWWGNWLADSPDRIKIAPKQWFLKPELDTTDLIPESWIRL